MKQSNINRESVLIPCKGRNFQNVEVKVVYDKGEWRSPRGYYVRITGANISDISGGCEMHEWCSDWPYKKYLVQKVDRKNPKRFKDLTDKVLSKAQEIAEKFLAEDYEAVWEYIPEV